MVRVVRWPLVNLRQLWAGGLPPVLARLWAHSYGSEPSCGSVVGQSKSRGCRMCFSVPHYELMPISITDQPSEHENCISLFFFSLLLPFLSLFLSIVWVNWESYRITAWQFLPVVWFLIITFIFLFWKKWQGNNSPIINIDISEKLQDQLNKLLLYHCIIIRL